LIAPRPVQAQGDKIYDRILKSTVWIAIPVKERATPDGRVPIRMGTGTLIDAQQKIVLTNFHVVGDAKDIFVFFPAYKDKKLVPERKHYVDALNNGGGLRATILAKESKIDLALIKLETVPEGAKVMPLAKDSPSPGTQIHSVGNPGASGALWIYTPGKVRQVYQKQFRSTGDGVALDIDARVIETDSPTNPGDSGGPLVNDRCELVGVTQGLAPNARNVSTFIDLSEVRTFLTKSKVRPVIASGGPATAKEKDAEDEKKAAAAKPMPPKPTVSPEEQKERQAAFKLKNAQQFANDGDVNSALEFCEEIVTKFPMTKAATEAKALLEKLKTKKKK
jgi:hypothetical protein